MYEEHKKEYNNACNEQFQYDLQFTKQNGLPNSMTNLYNASVYGQSITSLVDSMIIPATHVLDLKSVKLDKQVRNPSCIFDCIAYTY